MEDSEGQTKPIDTKVVKPAVSEGDLNRRAESMTKPRLFHRQRLKTLAHVLKPLALLLALITGIALGSAYATAETATHHSKYVQIAAGLVAAVSLVVILILWALKNLLLPPMGETAKRVLNDGLQFASYENPVDRTQAIRERRERLRIDLSDLFQAFMTGRAYWFTLLSLGSVLAGAVVAGQLVVMIEQTHRLGRQNQLIEKQEKVLVRQNNLMRLESQLAAINSQTEIDLANAQRVYDELTAILDTSQSAAAQVYAVMQIPDVMVQPVTVVDPSWIPNHEDKKPKTILVYPNLQRLAQRLIVFVKQPRITVEVAGDMVPVGSVSTAIVQAWHRLGYDNANAFKYGDCVWDQIFDQQGKLIELPDRWRDEDLSLLLKDDPWPMGEKRDEPSQWVTCDLRHIKPGQLIGGELPEVQLCDPQFDVLAWISTGADFAFISVRLDDLNLSKVNLSGAKLSYANLSGADLNNANLFGADLNNANLPGASLFRANLSGASLYRANLSDADLNDANLSGAKLSYANLSDADLNDANLSGAKLSYANLSGADLNNANLFGAYLDRADLFGANLYYANLSGADLNDANLSGASLFGADLPGAELLGANLTGAELFGANLSGADLNDANLSDASLFGADLFGANLNDANLSDASLFRANLSGASLYRANLSGADLRDAVTNDVAIEMVAEIRDGKHYWRLTNGLDAAEKIDRVALPKTLFKDLKIGMIYGLFGAEDDLRLKAESALAEGKLNALFWATQEQAEADVRQALGDEAVAAISKRPTLFDGVDFSGVLVDQETIDGWDQADVDVNIQEAFADAIKDPTLIQQRIDQGRFQLPDPEPYYKARLAREKAKAEGGGKEVVKTEAVKEADGGAGKGDT